MRIIDMHCDTLLEAWRKPELNFFDGDLSVNLKLLKENDCLVQFFAMYISRNEMEIFGWKNRETSRSLRHGCQTGYPSLEL